MTTELAAALARDEKIEDLLKAQREAALAYEAAEQRESLACSECTDALNRLNAAQRAVDAALAEIRKTAPHRSDWRSRGAARAESA